MPIVVAQLLIVQEEFVETERFIYGKIVIHL